MRILIAGASGAIGLPIVQRLVALGHDVTGLAGSPGGAQRVIDAGAAAVVVDVLDAEATRVAVVAARPEVVIDQLTALPRTYTPQAMRDTLPRTTAVRVTGGANLQAGAIAAGARRLVVQSGAYFSEPGPGRATEEVPFVADGPELVAGNVDAFRAVEERVLGAADALEGIVLRYGFFYGPGTWYRADGDMGHQARAGGLAVLGDGSGVWPFVHVDDAADATVAAALAPDARGVYNIVDDDQLPMREWLPAFARFVGAPSPASAPIEPGTDADAVFYATRLRGADIQRAQAELAFRPRRLEWLSSAAERVEGGAPVGRGA